MSVEVITKDDLQAFRTQLLNDLQQLLSAPPKEDKPEWVKSKYIRKYLDVSPGTLQNLRISGKLHPKRLDGSAAWYYSLAEIRALFNSNS